jgi:hypothetical protein
MIENIGFLGIGANMHPFVTPGFTNKNAAIGDVEITFINGKSEIVRVFDPKQDIAIYPRGGDAVYFKALHACTLHFLHPAAGEEKC